MAKKRPWDGGLSGTELLALDPATRRAILVARREQYELEAAERQREGFERRYLSEEWHDD